jgi:hypothetical protein
MRKRFPNGDYYNCDIMPALYIQPQLPPINRRFITNQAVISMKFGIGKK